jgi:hypothetical protein
MNNIVLLIVVGRRVAVWGTHILTGFDEPRLVLLLEGFDVGWVGAASVRRHGRGGVPMVHRTVVLVVVLK